MNKTQPLSYGSIGQSGQGHWPAVLAGFLGWTLDAFDFFLVTVSLSEIAKEFNRPNSDIALSLTITLAFRPVGALIFGLLADRYGRRLPLMLDLIFYSIVEIATGFAHSYVTFMVLRALFGIGMGGEWGVGASLVMEKVPARWRGVLSGVLQEGYAFGFLLAGLVSAFVLPRWGWRPMFWIGGLPAILAIFVRMHVKESEVWQRARRRETPGMRSSILAHWKLFLYLTLLMAGMNLSSHGTQDMYPTFLKNDHHFAPQRVGWITIIMQIGAIIGGIGFGLLSDRIGRRKAMLLAFVLAIICIPLWAFSHALALLVLGAFLIQFMVQGAWGVIPAHITELSPDSVRGLLPGFSYQCGVLIAASVPFIESVLAKHMSYGRAMALVALLVFLLAGTAVAVGPEKRGVEFGND
jgi:SHS family lactate transporter-like MFS transporter